MFLVHHMEVLFPLPRSVWASFLTDDPAAWIARVGEHNMFKDQGTHVDVPATAIYLHPDRNRKWMTDLLKRHDVIGLLMERIR